MNDFISNTFSIILELKFSPLVLIGLMITSLSLILNFKEGNIYLKEFKKHKNLEVFVKSIHRTTMILISMFLISIVSSYICVEDTNKIVLFGISILYLFLTIWMIKNLFSISYIIREIVLTSLKSDDS